MYKNGDIVYHVSNALYVRKATVIRSSGGFCTIKFEDNGSGTRVRETKLYRTERQAQAMVAQFQKQKEQNQTIQYK